MFIDEPAEYRRIQAFELQYFDGNGWKNFHAGTTIGPEWSAVVKPITASRVRLNILKSTDGPTIREFQLYGPSCLRICNEFELTCYERNPGPDSTLAFCVRTSNHRTACSGGVAKPWQT